MIISKYIELVITSRNIKKISKMLNKQPTIGETVFLPVEKLTYGSTYIVDVSCDYCNKQFKMEYKKYNLSTKDIKKISCNNKNCSNIKIKEVCLYKYGVENPFQLEDVKNKSKKTLNEKYGVDYPIQSNIIKEKIKQTNLEKYGVENYTKTIEYLEKTKIKNLEKYGTEWALQSDFIKDKSKKTNLEKYGVEYPSKSKEFRNSVEKTSLNKWGVRCNLISDKCKEKIKQTNLEKYGVENYTKTEKYREDSKIANNPFYINYTGDSISLFSCDCGKEHQFEIKSDNYLNRIKNNLPLCTICYPISRQNSIKELEVLKFIEENYKGDILPGYRDHLEIDIYLPEIKLGFEFNGLYWHSEEFKENNYHLNKILYFKERGIRIIHIYEDDWNNKKDIIKSQIKNYLGLTENKIFARKCIIKETLDSSVFLNNNHIQGNDKSVIKLGLYYNGKLVSLMTFDQFEGRKKMLKSEYNLSRFCNLLNCNVIGGASKLLNFFIKTYKPTRIISYADRSWSEGGLYYKLGFKLAIESKPDYKYIINGKRVHKSNFKMKNEKLEMINKGVKRIYDCGKLKFYK